MAHWLLQCNPAHLQDYLGDGRSAGAAWTVRRHREDMAAGDDVAIWLSGRTGGVVAVGHVTGAPYSSADKWLVPITYSRVLLDHPIPREVLKQDPRFAESLILRVPRGSNPFPVEDTAWPAITGHLPPEGSQLVAKTVMATAAVVAAGATAVREAIRTAVGAGR